MKLGTFNVHAWGDSLGKARVDDAIALFKDVGCDVLALQEVRASEPILERVAEALGMHCTSISGAGGNALLSRWPLAEFEVVELRGEFTERRAVIGRLAVATTPGGPTFPLDLVGLHLDHVREDDRLRQMSDLYLALSRRAPDHLLMGDFNAMRLADFEVPARRKMHDHRREQGWEPAKNDVMAELDQRGYIDAIRYARAGSLANYHELLPHPIESWHAVTCRFNTRIDYLFTSPSLAAKSVPKKSKTVLTDVSDHHLVTVEMDLFV